MHMINKTMEYRKNRRRRKIVRILHIHKLFSNHRLQSQIFVMWFNINENSQIHFIVCLYIISFCGEKGGGVQLLGDLFISEQKCFNTEMKATITRQNRHICIFRKNRSFKRRQSVQENQIEISVFVREKTIYGITITEILSRIIHVYWHSFVTKTKTQAKQSKADNC